MTDDKILCCRECTDKVVELEKRINFDALVCPECGKVYEEQGEAE